MKQESHQLGYPDSGSRFELGIARIRSISDNHSASTFRLLLRPLTSRAFSGYAAVLWLYTGFSEDLAVPVFRVALWWLRKHVPPNLWDIGLNPDVSGAVWSVEFIVSVSLCVSDGKRERWNERTVNKAIPRKLKENLLHYIFVTEIPSGLFEYRSMHLLEDVMFINHSDIFEYR
jgi:hypothetical protein